MIYSPYLPFASDPEPAHCSVSIRFVHSDLLEVQTAIPWCQGVVGFAARSPYIKSGRQERPLTDGWAALQPEPLTRYDLYFHGRDAQ